VTTELTHLVRSGQIEQFGKLFERHHQNARRQARRHISDQLIADDLVSRAFEKILSALLNGHGPDDSSFPSYLYVVLRNEAASMARQEALEHALVESLTILEPDRGRLAPQDDHGTERMYRTAAVCAYNSLSERHKQILRMTIINSFGKEKACQEFNLKANSVDALAYRARRRLRQNFVEELQKPGGEHLPAERREALTGRVPEQVRRSATQPTPGAS
jgi:RNA polymerase sigma factor (sigma-70 family)